MNKKVLITTITGAILGIFCIIGASARSVETLSTTYLFAFWFNRLLMGVLFGYLPKIKPNYFRYIRGFLFGIFVSFAFYSATSFYDLMGFVAGGVYGIIIEFVVIQFEHKKIM